jgi:hypothetical protein
MFVVVALLAAPLQGRVLSLPAGVEGPAFLDVAAVRELQDGRTLVIDWSDRALSVVSWSPVSVRTMGRTGDGPGEYRSPSQLLALGNDSTLVPDAQNGKWHVAHRDRLVSVLDRSQPMPRDWGTILSGTDTLGHLLVLLGTRFPDEVRARGPGINAYAESLVVVLVNRGSGKADSIAYVRGGFRGIARTSKTVSGGVIHYTLINPLAVGDQAVLFPDGWIAVAYASPYRVEWRSPGGGIVRGDPLPDTKVPVDERVKAQVIADQWPPSPSTPMWRPDEFPGWPAVLPPFLQDALLALPDGRLAVTKTMVGTSRPVRYDIVDRQGRLSGVLELQSGERLVGVGKGAVYSVLTDTDDSEILRRHPWP